MASTVRELGEVGVGLAVPVDVFHLAWAERPADGFVGAAATPDAHDTALECVRLPVGEAGRDICCQRAPPLCGGTVYLIHMRIKAWVITGIATALAGTALGIVVASNDPHTAESAVQWMFWAALALTAWGFWTTLLLVVRMNLGQAVWVGLVLAGATLGAVLVWRAGYHGFRLLGALVFVTLCLSFFIWHRLRGRT